MKKTSKSVILLMIAVMLTSCATMHKAGEFPIASEVIEAQGTKEELYSKSASWAVTAFFDSKGVIEYQDKEAGIIKGKFTVDVHPLVTILLDSIITIETKDNKARITIEQTGKAYDPSLLFPYFDEVADPFYQNYVSIVNELIVSYRNALTSTLEKEDW